MCSVWVYSVQYVRAHARARTCVCVGMTVQVYIVLYVQ